jgi:RimJ/RimL family protein N-acetyltransferase
MVTLRPARKDDEDRLLGWRNEPSTRAASLTHDEISADDHHAWFVRRLDDPACRLLIIEEDGRAVGQVRLDRTAPGVAYVSIGLADDARGRRLGREALRLARNDAHHALQVRELRAMVRRGNDASLRAFRAAGYTTIGESADVIELSTPAGG